MTEFNGGSIQPTNQTVLYKEIMQREVGKYSMWQETMYRIGLGYFGFTETNNSVQWASDGYMQYHGGYQTGDNWAELPSSEMQVNYDRDGIGTLQWGRDIGSDTLAVFNPDTATIEWPAEPTNPTGPDGQVQQGSTTEENLTKWCEKYEINLDWFKTKYPNWATVTITEQLVKQVSDIDKKARFDYVNYTPSSINRVCYFGRNGVALWKGDHDYNHGDSHGGLRLVIQIPTTRAILKR